MVDWHHDELADLPGVIEQVEIHGGDAHGVDEDHRDGPALAELIPTIGAVTIGDRR